MQLEHLLKGRARLRGRARSGHRGASRDYQMDHRALRHMLRTWGTLLRQLHAQVEHLSEDRSQAGDTASLRSGRVLQGAMQRIRTLRRDDAGSTCALLPPLLLPAPLRVCLVA